MFRRPKVSKKLSADELKSKLYAHFDKSGSLNQLRSQIRSQLTSELFKMAPPSVLDHSNKTVGFENTLLPLQVCNWLVFDHLVRQGYQYTLSTFVSETNSPYPEKLLAVGDILALVGLDSSSSEYNKISDLYSKDNEKDGLHSLLLAIIKSVIFIPDKNSQPIETSVTSGRDTANGNKLAPKNVKHADKSENYVQLDSFVRKASCVKDLGDSTSVESSYHEQLRALKEERDNEIQNLRRKLVQELERIHLQEQSFYQEIEQERRETRKERDLLFGEREKLKRNEGLLLKEQENKLEKKLHEIEKIHAAKLHSKEKEVTALQNELKEKERKLNHLEFELSTHRDRSDALKQEFEELNRMYRSIHEKYNSLLDENTNLVRKFEKMSDYNVLKDEIAAKVKDISILQREIENLQRTAERDKKAYTETVTSLELKLKATEPKLQHIQKELNQTKDILHMEESLWHKEKERLEQDSLSSKQLYKTVLQRIEEQKQDIQDLHQTIHILHYQITSGSTNLTTKSDAYDSLKTNPKVAPFSSKNNSIWKSSKNPISISQHYRERALSFTADYKSRLNKLQQEVNEGFDKYSLIYHTSIDTKKTNANSSLPYIPQIFDPSMRTNLPSFSKNISNSPFISKYDSTKGFGALGDLNFKYKNVMNPSFNIYKNSDRLCKTVTSFENLSSSTRTFISNNANLASATNTEQTLKPFEKFRLNTLINKTHDKNKESEDIENATFLSHKTVQNRLGMNETHGKSSSEKNELKITENSCDTSEAIANEKAAHFLNDSNLSTCRTEDLFVSKNASSAIPQYSSDLMIQTLSTNSSKQFEANLSKNSSDSTHQNPSTESLIQNMATPVTAIIQTNSESTNLTASIDLPKRNEVIIPFAKTSLGSANQTASNDSQIQNEAIIPFTQTSSSSANQTASTDSQKQNGANQIISFSEITSGATNETASTTSLKHEAAAPIVVDLDAAWKRKSSLPTVNSPLIPSSNSLTKNLIPENKPEESIFKERSKHINSSLNLQDANKQHFRESISVDIPPSRDSDNIFSDEAKNREQPNQLDKDIHGEAASIKNSEDLCEKQSQSNKSVILSDIDENVQEKSKYFDASQVKQTPEESLSEMSEIHMSCGSEQEEQKEESDNW